jgi:hypothetical protein
MAAAPSKNKTRGTMMSNANPGMAMMVAALLFGGVASAATAADNTSIEARLRALEDRQAIERVLMEYGRSLDNRDFATYSNLFAQNGEWNGGTGVFRGPAAIKVGMEKSFGAATDIPKGSNFHILTNAIIDLNGDRATAVSKWAFMRVVEGKPQVAMTGRYEDEFVRERGAWKILTRKAPADSSPTALQAK